MLVIYSKFKIDFINENVSIELFACSCFTFSFISLFIYIIILIQSEKMSSDLIKSLNIGLETSIVFIISHAILYMRRSDIHLDEINRFKGSIKNELVCILEIIILSMSSSITLTTYFNSLYILTLYFTIFYTMYNFQQNTIKLSLIHKTIIIY